MPITAGDAVVDVALFYVLSSEAASINGEAQRRSATNRI